MEESKKTVEGEQPDSNQNELKQEATGTSSLNNKPEARKALIKASKILGTRNSSKKSTAPPSQDRSNASIASTQVKRLKQPKAPENKTPLTSKAILASSVSKTMVPEVPDEISPVEPDLETLKKKALKAEKKVDKLKKKVKKAKKKVVKKSKLKTLKDKLIKALTKLKRSNKKLKKASEQ